jgi:molybdopterin-guanine dinucleotide biosynthesis protein A
VAYDDISAAIIAGGAATRMGGRAKALIEIDGEPIIDRQLGVLRSLFTEIVIAANDPAPFGHTGLPVVADRYPGRGPLAGLDAAFAACDRDYVFAVACDMPYLDAGNIDLVVGRRGSEIDIVAPFTNGYPEPLCALYARSCRPLVERLLAGDRNRMSGLFATEESSLTVVEIDARELQESNPRFLTNINTARDLE